ncbi:MAG: nucleotide kinase domain-containing protein [Patescibacteria group bacterium]
MKTNSTELPQNLKDLYRHWKHHTHTHPDKLDPKVFFKNEKLFNEILWFIKERINIWKKKTAAQKEPFTNNETLSKYRFTNVFRELDRQTIEFHTLLNPLRNNFPLWLLNMFYCRMVARPETVRQVGLLSFDKNENEALYERLMDSPRPRYGTPYVFPISVIQRTNTPTRELFIAKYLPAVMEKVAKEISSWNKMSVYEGTQKVVKIFGCELHFHWTEVLIDTAYQFPHLIDLFDRFPAGPGAAPTLAKINQNRDSSWLVVDLSRLNVATRLTFENRPLCLSAENWEGIACEFRKYTNLKEGTGRRRLYKNSVEKPNINTLFQTN